MVGRAVILVTSAPYGRENTYGGLYTAIASLDLGLRTVVVLTGDGVYAALKGQSAEKSLGYPTIGDLFHQTHPRAKIYAESSSLRERGLEKTDLIEIVEPIEDAGLLEVFVKYGEAIITY